MEISLVGNGRLSGRPSAAIGLASPRLLSGGSLSHYMLIMKEVAGERLFPVSAYIFGQVEPRRPDGGRLGALFPSMDRRERTPKSSVITGIGMAGLAGVSAMRSGFLGAWSAERPLPRRGWWLGAAVSAKGAIGVEFADRRHPQPKSETPLGLPPVDQPTRA